MHKPIYDKEDLLVKYVKGTLADKELEIIQRWMQKDANKVKASELLRLYRTYKSYKAYDEINEDIGIENVLSKVKEIKRKRRFIAIRNIAASIVLFAGSLSAIYWLTITNVDMPITAVNQIIEPGSNKASLTTVSLIGYRCNGHFCSMVRMEDCAGNQREIFGRHRGSLEKEIVAFAT